MPNCSTQSSRMIEYFLTDSLCYMNAGKNNTTLAKFCFFREYENAQIMEAIDTLLQMFINDENALKDINIFTILSSIKCFKYFLLNCRSLFPHFNFDENIVRSAIIGRNIEIFLLSFEKYH